MMRILFAFYFGVELTERFSIHWVNYEMTGVKGMCSVYDSIEMYERASFSHI